MPFATVASPDTTVEQEIICRQCGYNLRGLAVSGRCPECNTPVAHSMHSELLQFADPQWIKRLILGTILLIAALLSSTVFAIGSYVVPFLFGSTAMTYFYVAERFASALIWALARWEITAPDPSGIGEREYGRTRRWIRGASLVNLSSPLWGMSGIALGSSIRPLIQYFAVRVLVSSLQIALDIWQYGYLSKLAGRIPDESLAARARLFRILVPALAGVSMLEGLIFITLVVRTGINAGSGVFRSHMIVTFTLGFAHFGVSIGVLIFLISYTRALRVQHAAAANLRGE